MGGAAEQVRDRRGDVHQAAGARDEPVGAHALARDHERGPGLDDAGRAVLAEVAALILPIVGRGVDHAEVGGRRVVEELGDRVVRERVGVLGPVGELVGQLVVERGELVGGLVGERVGAGARPRARSRPRPGPVRRNTVLPSWVRAS